MEINHFLFLTGLGLWADTFLVTLGETGIEYKKFQAFFLN